MTFGEALKAMRAGREVRRASWEPGLSVEVSGGAIVWISRRNGEVHRSEWPASHASLLAEDWSVARPRARRDGA